MPLRVQKSFAKMGLSRFPRTNSRCVGKGKAFPSRKDFNHQGGYSHYLSYTSPASRDIDGGESTSCRCLASRRPLDLEPGIPGTTCRANLCLILVSQSQASCWQVVTRVSRLLASSSYGHNWLRLVIIKLLTLLQEVQRFEQLRIALASAQSRLT